MLRASLETRDLELLKSSLHNHHVCELADLIWAICSTENKVIIWKWLVSLLTLVEDLAYSP